MRSAPSDEDVASNKAVDALIKKMLRQQRQIDAANDLVYEEERDEVPCKATNERTDSSGTPDLNDCGISRDSVDAPNSSANGRLNLSMLARMSSAVREKRMQSKDEASYPKEQITATDLEAPDEADGSKVFHFPKYVVLSKQAEHSGSTEIELGMGGDNASRSCEEDSSLSIDDTSTESSGLAHDENCIWVEREETVNEKSHEARFKLHHSPSPNLSIDSGLVSETRFMEDMSDCDTESNCVVRAIVPIEVTNDLSRSIMLSDTSPCTGTIVGLAERDHRDGESRVSKSFKSYFSDGDTAGPMKQKGDVVGRRCGSFKSSMIEHRRSIDSTGRQDVVQLVLNSSKTNQDTNSSQQSTEALVVYGSCDSTTQGASATKSKNNTRKFFSRLRRPTMSRHASESERNREKGLEHEEEVVFLPNESVHLTPILARKSSGANRSTSRIHAETESSSKEILSMDNTANVPVGSKASTETDMQHHMLKLPETTDKIEKPAWFEKDSAVEGKMQMPICQKLSSDLMQCQGSSKNLKTSKVLSRGLFSRFSSKTKTTKAYLEEADSRRLQVQPSPIPSDSEARQKQANNSITESKLNEEHELTPIVLSNFVGDPTAMTPLSSSLSVSGESHHLKTKLSHLCVSGESHHIGTKAPTWKDRLSLKRGSKDWISTDSGENTLSESYTPDTKMSNSVEFSETKRKMNGVRFSRLRMNRRAGKRSIKQFEGDAPEQWQDATEALPKNSTAVDSVVEKENESYDLPIPNLELQTNNHDTLPGIMHSEFAVVTRESLPMHNSYSTSTSATDDTFNIVSQQGKKKKKNMLKRLLVRKREKCRYESLDEESEASGISSKIIATTSSARTSIKENTDRDGVRSENIKTLEDNQPEGAAITAFLDKTCTTQVVPDRNFFQATSLFCSVDDMMVNVVSNDESLIERVDSTRIRESASMDFETLGPLCSEEQMQWLKNIGPQKPTLFPDQSRSIHSKTHASQSLQSAEAMSRHVSKMKRMNLNQHHTLSSPRIQNSLRSIEKNLSSDNEEIDQSVQLPRVQSAASTAALHKRYDQAASSHFKLKRKNAEKMVRPAEFQNDDVLVAFPLCGTPTQ